MPHEFTTRATSEPENIRAQIKDLRILAQKHFDRRMDALEYVIETALEEHEAGGITQETCLEGVARFNKAHHLIDRQISGRLDILHFCMQSLLPPGVSEGNKC